MYHATINKTVVETDDFRSRMDRLGLEVVFSPLSQWYDRIMYDSREGKYYDRYSDMYIDQLDVEK